MNKDIWEMSYIIEFKSKILMGIKSDLHNRKNPLTFTNYELALTINLSKYTKQNLITIIRKTDKSTILVGNF